MSWSYGNLRESVGMTSGSRPSLLDRGAAGLGKAGPGPVDQLLEIRVDPTPAPLPAANGSRIKVRCSASDLPEEQALCVGPCQPARPSRPDWAAMTRSKLEGV